MCKRHVFALIHSCCLQVSDFVAEHYVQNGYRYRAVFKHENMAKHRRNPASRWKEAVDSGRKCSSMTSKPPSFPKGVSREQQARVIAAARKLEDATNMYRFEFC